MRAGIEGDPRTGEFPVRTYKDANGTYLVYPGGPIQPWSSIKDIGPDFGGLLRGAAANHTEFNRGYVHVSAIEPQIGDGGKRFVVIGSNPIEVGANDQVRRVFGTPENVRVAISEARTEANRLVRTPRRTTQAV